MFAGKKITVGITGGIAAYKAAEIVSWLVKNRADTQVAMTSSACRFITPLTMKTLSGKPVAVDIFSEDGGWNVPHIDIAMTDLFLILPATANIIAKAAAGLADDLLSAALLATKAPVLMAPAMHVNMYANAATQANIELLRKRGFRFIEPGEGRLACGSYGKGRLADLEVIKGAIERVLAENDSWNGVRVLVTAGPTREKLDPVRYISNRSSGKMGYALAEAARARGASVTLVSGPVALPAPQGVDLISVENAEEMYQAVWRAYEQTDVVVAAAAVADFRPQEQAARKIKKSAAPESIRLTANSDILASLGREKGGRILVGFAAETENLLQSAKGKLAEKNLDLIVANDVSAPGAGFDCDTNIVTLIDAAATKEYPKMSKKELAGEILDHLSRMDRFINKFGK
ncbi:MAG: bifunctional phosphopantothenoylcysteine decarboxylase/phosphopantothenate--cysteine ligase CoaBC [Clostridiales bacterium]|nr:bifunctional phosphopantothenoylcysteine decarboxylase/phosphopantothenate--cysteine ligase CoaBC [Clostridiales bacterium]